jgi:hypothetical protein
MRPLILFAILAVIIAGALYAVRTGAIDVPPDWNPWAPLDVNAEPNFLTRHKLERLSRSSEQCQQVLATTHIEYQRLDDRTTGAACGFFNAVRVEKTSAGVGKAFSLSCRAAVSLAMWERHVLEPAAQKHFGQSVATLEHFGSYSCRNVYGRPDATRSRHATAEAWDVAGFVLADGQRIRVVRDWQGEGEAATFLREVRDGACRFFDGVLSPDYNAAHRDHLHLDRGPLRMCR